MKPIKQLENHLQRIDGKGYKAYKDIQGAYQDGRLELHIDYVQGDPFASPSRIRIQLSQQSVQLEQSWFNTEARKISVEDFLTRRVASAIRKADTNSRGTGKSGMIAIDAPGQEVLPRTSVKVDREKVDARLSVGLPARGRRVLGKQASSMLCKQIPEMIKQALLTFDRNQLQRHLQLIDQQVAIRQFLQENGYVSFVANGAILPRESGISNRPLPRNAIPFQSPSSLEIEIPIPYQKTITGMGIPRGVTLIVGGGYHGKSTLLQAIERGVYDHIPGDGREYVLTEPSACKVRAEDGRRVEKVNISPFISNLPFTKETDQFSTEDASGSTSQAANIMEMLEMNSQLLLIDEDTSATNFMIRDARMQELVAKGKEPITPFVDKVRGLFHDHGVSTVLVLGGSGDYFDVADHVIMMDEYRPFEVTEQAQAIARRIDNQRKEEGGGAFGPIMSRTIRPGSFQAQKGKKEKVDARGLHTILYGTEQIELSHVEQIVDPSQTRAMAQMIRYLSKRMVDGNTTLSDVIDQLYAEIDTKGLDVISPYYGKHPGDLALPRKTELAAAINRLRSLKVKGR